MYSQSCHLKISGMYSSLTPGPNKNNNHTEFLVKTCCRRSKQMTTRRSYWLIAILISGLLLTAIPSSDADTFRPVVRGRRGVVAGGHPLSVEAGMRVLQHGGNAVDAGVATILAASVIEFSHFSFGGEVPILIRMNGKNIAMQKSGVHVIEGMGTAPAKATREFFVN